MWNDKCEPRRKAAIFAALALGTMEGAEVRALGLVIAVLLCLQVRMLVLLDCPGWAVWDNVLGVSEQCQQCMAEFLTFCCGL